MRLPRLRLRLRGLMVLVAVAAVACLVGFWPQIARRQAAARRQAYIEGRLKQVFSDRGLWILQGATEIEVYPVREKDSTMAPGVITESVASHELVVIGASKRRGRDWAQRFGRLLLEGERYLVMVGGDDPPQFVVRLRRDEETLTIVVSTCGLMQIDGILQISVDLVDSTNQVRHVSFLTDCHDKGRPGSPSISDELRQILSD